MEDSSSTTLSSTQEKTQETVPPCYFIEALSAILKCLGLQMIMKNQHNSSSNSDQKVNEATDEATTDPKNTDLQADPPSVTLSLSSPSASLSNFVCRVICSAKVLSVNGVDQRRTTGRYLHEMQN